MWVLIMIDAFRIWACKVWFFSCCSKAYLPLSFSYLHIQSLLLSAFSSVPSSFYSSNQSIPNLQPLQLALNGYFISSFPWKESWFLIEWKYFGKLNYHSIPKEIVVVKDMNSRLINPILTCFRIPYLRFFW